jgi:hypothetical protein
LDLRPEFLQHAPGGIHQGSVTVLFDELFPFLGIDKGIYGRKFSQNIIFQRIAPFVKCYPILSHSLPFGKWYALQINNFFSDIFPLLF